jgi:hypothetical protein
VDEYWDRHLDAMASEISRIHTEGNCESRSRPGAGFEAESEMIKVSSLPWFQFVSILGPSNLSQIPVLFNNEAVSNK